MDTNNTQQSGGLSGDDTAQGMQPVVPPQGVLAELTAGARVNDPIIPPIAKRTDLPLDTLMEEISEPAPVVTVSEPTPVEVIPPEKAQEISEPVPTATVSDPIPVDLPVADPVESQTTLEGDENFVNDIVEPWIEAIEGDISEEEILAHVNRIRANTIRPVDGSHYWKASVSVDGSLFDITIDLENIVWRSGSANEVMRRLSARTLESVGVTVVPATGAPAILSDQWVKALLDSEAHVIDPNPSLPELSLAENLPAGVKYAVVDLPNLMSSRSDIGQMNAGELESFFSSHLMEYEQHVQCFNEVNQIVRRSDPVNVREMTAAIFLEIGRSSTEPLCSVYLTLTSALAARGTVDALYESVVSSRELMMALRMIERDPTSAIPQSEKLQAILRRGVELQNERDLRLALDELLAIEMPEGANMKLTGTDGVSLENVGERLASNDANINQGAVNLQIIEVLEDISAYLDTNDDLRSRVGEKYGPIDGVFDHRRFALSVEQAFNEVQSEDKSPVLSSAAAYEQGIQENFDQLRNAQEERRETGPAVCWTVARRALAHAGLLDVELERAVRDLQDAIREMPLLIRISTDLAMGAFPYEGDANLSAVEEWNRGRSFMRLRDHLSIPAMTFASGVAFSGPFFYAASQGSSAIYAAVALVIGSLVGGIMTAVIKPRGSFKGFNALAKYERLLYREENIGLTLEEAAQPERRDIRLMRLIDGYFRVKYLYNLPLDDQKRLPKSQALTRTLRRMHSTIINRALESFESITPLSKEEIRQMRDAGMRVDDATVQTLNIADREQVVHDFLIGTVYYTLQRKREMLEMAMRCYKPIEDALLRHQKYQTILHGFGIGKIFKGFHVKSNAKQAKAGTPAVKTVVTPTRMVIPPAASPSPCV